MAAAGAWLRRAAAPVPRILFPFPALPAHPPPAPVLEVPSVAHPAGGIAMDLMAVPKKKVSKYKKGLRNGPKALNPVPVIVRCRCCGRVKL